MKTAILGISAYYHDSAAALLVDGRVVAAAQQERFSRQKHDAGFPADAVEYVLREGGVPVTGLTHVVFYDKPLLKFERLLETYLAFAPRGFKSFVRAIPIWLKEKLFLKRTLREELCRIGGATASELPSLLFTRHHQSHAASAFFASPFESAAVLCLDGVGEWATTTAWRGDGNHLDPLWQIDFPHSLGLLYSAFTYYTGFRVLSGEYKLMGLAPYGEPRYVDLILEQLIDLKDDGTFRLDMNYFDYATGLTMTNRRFDALFGGPPRQPESPLTQKEMDIARSIQAVTEEIVLRLARTLYDETGEPNLCMAGGVALNCVANGRVLREGPFDEIWIQPAAGDAGGALGGVLSAWHEYLDQPREAGDIMRGAYLGPAFSMDEVRSYLESVGAPFESLDDGELFERVAAEMEAGKVVGWFQGRMEFGPRALGARSILGDARSREMQRVMNLKIKYRESFRPFAPAVKAEAVSDWFEHDRDSPYMLLVAQVAEHRRIETEAENEPLFGIEKLKVPRSEIPAVTHVDGSARVQTVHRETNPRFHALIEAFERRTGCPVLVNTSFNVRGEPIVMSPEHAYRCFMRTEMDLLVLENCLLYKDSQPEPEEEGDWRKEFELD
ncbi:MAG: carbamoyltransferase [Xanthomonadales bacterium]|nr:carbamoyltransferase [Xanthomonadales bacterium]